MKKKYIKPTITAIELATQNEMLCTSTEWMFFDSDNSHGYIRLSDEYLDDGEDAL